MRLTNLAEVAHYQHIYFSPHLDDAVLSCGGAILKQRHAGEHVLVITLCTAAPSPEGPFNELAQEFHRFWALPPDQVVAARLQEDAEAMDRLGADFVWADFSDAIYRRPDAYTTRESLFGTPIADDPLLDDLVAYIGDLRKRTPQAAIYAPLGVGFHVDHQITHRATLQTGEHGLIFYEDFPYAAHAGAVEARRSSLDRQFSPHLEPIASVLEQKINAIAAYASQLDELFRERSMAETVGAYHAAVGGTGSAAERTWLLATE